MLVEQSQQQAAVSVNVSASLCETVVALFGEAGESLCIHNDTSLELQVLQSEGVFGQLVPSGVYQIRSPDTTHCFCLQIPGNQPTGTIHVARGAANHGQPISLPHGARKTFVRIDVSDAVVRIKPAFTVENRLPESMFISLKQRTADCAVNIPPGKTEGIYMGLNGRFPIDIELLRAECQSERPSGEGVPYPGRGTFTDDCERPSGGE